MKLENEYVGSCGLNKVRTSISTYLDTSRNVSEGKTLFQQHVTIRKY